MLHSGLAWCHQHSRYSALDHDPPTSILSREVTPPRRISHRNSQLPNSESRMQLPMPNRLSTQAMTTRTQRRSMSPSLTRMRTTVMTLRLRPLWTVPNPRTLSNLNQSRKTRKRWRALMKMKMMMTIQMTLTKLIIRRNKQPNRKFPRIRHMSKTNSLSAVKIIQISFKNNRKLTRRLKMIKLMVMTMMRTMMSIRKIKTRKLFLAKKTLNSSLNNRMMKLRTKRNMTSNNNKSSLKSRSGRSKCLILLKQSSTWSLSASSIITWQFVKLSEAKISSTTCLSSKMRKTSKSWLPMTLSRGAMR